MRILASVVCCLLLCGCAREDGGDADLRMEWVHLVIRMFHSMDSGDGAAAAEQAKKLQALDPENTYLITIMDTQRGNALIGKAQKLLDSGRLDEAIAVLEEGRRGMPFYGRIGQEIRRLRLLAVLQDAVRSYENASGLSERNAALLALERTAEQVNHGELTAELARRREALDLEIADERGRAEAAAHVNRTGADTENASAGKSSDASDDGVAVRQ